MKHECQKEYNYIFVHITVDVNKTSVLVAGVKYSCSATHITVSKRE